MSTEQVLAVMEQLVDELEAAGALADELEREQLDAKHGMAQGEQASAVRATRQAVLTVTGSLEQARALITNAPDPGPRYSSTRP